MRKVAEVSIRSFIIHARFARSSDDLHSRFLAGFLVIFVRRWLLFGVSSWFAGTLLGLDLLLASVVRGIQALSTSKKSEISIRNAISSPDVIPYSNIFY